MTLRRVYRFRLEPNAEQNYRLYQLAGARRFVYNWALSRRKEYFASHGKGIPAAELSLELTALKRQDERTWLQEADSQLLQQALKDVDHAFLNFFEKRARFPQFKSKKAGHFAFRIPQRVKIESGKVYCPKIGWIRIRQSQAVEGETKSATFKRDACGHWFVTLTSEFEMPDTALPAPINPVGVDLGLKDFVTLSNGESTPAPRFFRVGQKKLKQAQRKLSRCKHGSRRRQKAKVKAAKVHRKTANQRADFVHKQTTNLVRRFDAVCIEDLNNKGIAKNKRLSKSVNDAAFGEFRRQLQYKAVWNRKYVAVISRWFPSSKLCGNCGAVNTGLILSDRTWLCECGTFHNRDLNAAQNILAEGLKLLEVAVGQTETKNSRRGRVRLSTKAAPVETRIPPL